MDYKQWIKKEIETGKTWDDLKNISEEEFLELRDDRAIIPEDVEYSSWRAIVSDREKSYVGFAKKTGISSSDSLEFQIPDSKFSCWRQYKASLTSKMKDEAIDDVEQSSHWLLNQLAYKSGIKKGLVMGSVQSGKTANMIEGRTAHIKNAKTISFQFLALALTASVASLKTLPNLIFLSLCLINSS